MIGDASGREACTEFDGKLDNDTHFLTECSKCASLRRNVPDRVGFFSSCPAISMLGNEEMFITLTA